jgi:DNA-binding NarL/FixJ family response regulator
VQERAAIYIRNQFGARFRRCGELFSFKTEPDMSMKDKMLQELNPLELRCLSLAARGRTREDITRETDICHDRIDEAFNSAMQKLQAGNVAEAIFRAARMDLIS